MAEKPDKPEKRMMSYVVFEQLEDDTWRRITEITVPAKTRQRTVIERAVASLERDAVGMAGAAVQMTLMIVSAETQPVTVRFEQQPPKLVIE